MSQLSLNAVIKITKKFYVIDFQPFEIINP
jgi:hypothetical protein